MRGVITLIMNNEEFEEILSRYDYELPEELIAQTPAQPRDAARLMVYDRMTGKISEDIFKNIAKYLPVKSVLVFNETKVIPARLAVRKITGGRVDILFVGFDKKFIKILAPKKLREGERLDLLKNIYFTVEKRDGQFCFLKPSFPVKDIYKILEKYGEMPIPPYIKNSPLTKSELKKEYQTVFAKNNGSVAAPTAALHFTKNLINKIKRAGHEIVFITLHVNLGTFAPLTEENLKTGKLHGEYYEIRKSVARKLNTAKSRGQEIIAMGTTVTRTLETASDDAGILKILKGETILFIYGDIIPLIRPNEGYDKGGMSGGGFKFIDAIVTNFHVPRSSLMMLVSALVGREKLLELYRLAIRKKFRFFSFGDGMLIL